MEPVKVLIPQKKMPFTMAVAVRLLVLTPAFGMSILMLVTGFQDFNKTGIVGLFTFIPGIGILGFSTYFLIKIFILKRRKLSQLKYFFYSDRLVIYNHVKNQILHELFYNEFPEFTFHENLNNFGFIVIGPEEPIFTRTGAFKRVGVNMKDADIMLENLPEVKKEYLFLKELIEKYQAACNIFSWEFNN